MYFLETWGTNCIHRVNLRDQRCSFAFFFLYNFTLISKTSEYSLYKFTDKNVDIAFWSKFLTYRNKGYFRTNFTWFFFSFERNFHFFLGPLYMLSISFGAKTTTLYSSQNTWPVGQKGIFIQILTDFFIYLIFNIVLQLFLRPLNILSKSFRANMATLHSGRNSWSVGTRGIFVQNLQQFFFYCRRIFHFFSWTTKYAICVFWCKNADIVFLSKFLTSQTKWHFLTNFTRFIFLFLFKFFL